MTGFTALVLAGMRPSGDPVAAAEGVSSKGLVVVAGRSLLERVIEALAEAGAARILVSAQDPAVRDAAGAIAPAPRLEAIDASESPSLSVLRAFERVGAPLLVTTVDHALLRPEWVTRFLRDTPADADVAALVAREDVVAAAAPETRRTYLRFRDGGYSGCNLFQLRSGRAVAAVELWRRLETERKSPLRMARAIGPGFLLSALLRLHTLDETVDRLGRRLDLKAAAVRSPWGEAAIDVDKPSDLALVRALSAAPDLRPRPPST